MTFEVRIDALNEDVEESDQFYIPALICTRKSKWQINTKIEGKENGSILYEGSRIELCHNFSRKITYYQLIAHYCA